jgi:hypothetical protein
MRRTWTLEEAMGKVAMDISISLDGFVTAPGTDLEHGLGVGGRKGMRTQGRLAGKDASTRPSRRPRTAVQA